MAIPVQTHQNADAAMTAMRHILNAISAHRGDEAPVFDVILENACRLCNAPMAWIAVVDAVGDHIIIPASRGVSEQYAAGLAEFRHPIAGSELTAVRAMVERQVVREDDIAESDLYRQRQPNRVSMVENEGIRSIATVPLLNGDKGIGAILLYRREVDPFTDHDIALIETFAAQAVIAIENVRQFREVQERLDRERATKEVLSVISTSRDDETPVFDKILSLARELCEAEMTTLLLVNSDRTALTYIGAAGTDISKLEAGFTIPIDDPMGVAVAARTGEVVNNPDLKDDDLYRQGHPVRVRLVDEEGIRSQLAVPLLQGDQSIGVLALNRREQKTFTSDEVALIESFAAQAVIAIENVRQFREVQERLERERASAEILEVISHSRDDDKPVFDAILKNACNLCNAPQAALILGTAKDDFQSMAADVNAAAAAVEMFRSGKMPMDGNVSYAARSIIEARLIAFDDMRDSDLYVAGSPVVRSMVDDSGIRSVLFVPLIKDAVAIGNITLFRYEVDPFNDFEVALIESFAAQAVIAIENVRQFKALETLNAELGDRVQDQVGEIERMGRLKRFLPAAVADAVVTSGDESMLTSHRAMVATLFCDMRGFTAFCEAAEPEETIEVLQTYHQEMSDLIDEYGGGVDQRAGDGIMVIFNDPIPVDDPAGDAVRLAVAMRKKMRELCAGWKRLGHRLGFGIGISLGYATVGMVGSAGRFDYTASGTSVNTAARLCDMAADGEVLISPRVWVAVEGDFAAESRGEVEMKGIREPVEVFAVR